ncbi:MAG: hypothetical protein IKO85_03895 [Bacteroidaceae bacterium]|nr:hypothetical protein [Bacteroidaceae bacterium]
MKKILYLAAVVSVALTSCMNDEFVGDENALNAAGERPIEFGLELKNATRAESDHATSAANLGNQFIVWGEKSTGASDTKDAPSAGHIVFPNYQVNYTANSAYTTTSNTKDWEYVGYTHSGNYPANITYKASASAAVTGSTSAQTIKYWDYSAGSYTFTAVSASKLDGSSKTDIENGYVKIQKNIDDDDKASEKGYTVTVTAAADLTKLYFSDRTVITQSAGTDRNAPNAYGGNVTLRFRNALSEVRAGIYETISGYDISDIHFYVTSDVEAKVSDVDAFGAICPNIKGSGYAGTLTVTYSEETATLNQPLVSASGTVAADLILGTNTNTITTSNLLGKSSTSPTWDTNGGTFTTVMLQAAHTTNMKVKCDYTLYNPVSGETIKVKGATAEVPSQYLQWKPNYKYTYLFKISNNTNGVTNPSLGPAGLWPITFDAIEITKDDGQVEYITTVSEPSITSYAKASAVITDDEYLAGNTIYVAVEDGSTNPTLTVGTNAKLYTATLEAGAAQELTEVSIANALMKGVAGYDGGTVLTKGTLLDGYYTESAGTYTACTASTYADGTTTYYRSATKVVTDALGKKLAVFDVSTGLTAVSEIAAGDSYSGEAISINGAKFSPAAATFTVVATGTSVTADEEYYTAADGSTKTTIAENGTASENQYWTKTTSAAGVYVFEYEKPAVQATGTYVAGTKYYTTAACDVEVDTSSFVTGSTDVSSYYLAPTKHYKVIKVVDKY